MISVLSQYFSFWSIFTNFVHLSAYKNPDIYFIPHYISYLFLFANTCTGAKLLSAEFVHSTLRKVIHYNVKVFVQWYCPDFFLCEKKNWTAPNNHLIFIFNLLFLWSGGGRVVRLLACGARGPGFDSPSRHLNFRDWLYPASKSRYGWNAAKTTYILNTTNHQNYFYAQPLIPLGHLHRVGTKRRYYDSVPLDTTILLWGFTMEHDTR